MGCPFETRFKKSLSRGSGCTQGSTRTWQARLPQTFATFAVSRAIFALKLPAMRLVSSGWQPILWLVCCISACYLVSAAPLATSSDVLSENRFSSAAVNVTTTAVPLVTQPVPISTIPTYPYPIGTSGSCNWSQIDCHDHGYFNDSDCLEWLTDNFPTAWKVCHCDSGNENLCALFLCFSLDHTQFCFTTGWQGTGCDILKNTSQCNANATVNSTRQGFFDGYYVNLNAPKYIECMVDKVQFACLLAAA